MNLALASLAACLPLAPERFGHLNDGEVQDLDQFIYRFSKLQDAMDGRFFTASCCKHGKNPTEDRPLLDQLDRLEPMGFIRSAESWQQIRTTRNRFAHEYPDDWDKNAALINRASTAAQELDCVLSDIQNRPMVLGLTKLLPN